MPMRKWTTFYDELSSLNRHVSKHNVLIIGGDMRAKTEMINSPYTTYHIEMKNI